MIETWSLPGPSALVARLVTHLVDGRQCLLRGTPPTGLRRALEDALAIQQIQLRVIFDDANWPPDQTLRREGGTEHIERLPAGVWWIDGVGEKNGAGWIPLVETLAERLRQDGCPAGQRPKLVIAIPGEPRPSTVLDVAVICSEPLGRADLEVAARFAAATSDETGLLTRLRIAVAVEMAIDFLPSSAALERLEMWMTAPRPVFCEVRRFAAFARDCGVEVECPEFALWRAQHTVLLAEIEHRRLALVRAHLERWPLPYLVESMDGRSPKRIETAELLELKHLCAVLRDFGEPRHSPLRSRLQALRDLRNALSHLEPASSADLALLEAPLTG